eukprot:733839-Pelagomonas_calceolata.AAC.5
MASQHHLWASALPSPFVCLYEKAAGARVGFHGCGQPPLTSLPAEDCVVDGSEPARHTVVAGAAAVPKERPDADLRAAAHQIVAGAPAAAYGPVSASAAATLTAAQALLLRSPKQHPAFLPWPAAPDSPGCPAAGLPLCIQSQ